jgi:hypothetical protein
MFVNDEWERYARMLQLSGEVALHPWSVRAFGAVDLARLAARTAAHPWSAARNDSIRRIGWLSYHPLPARAQVIFNSQFPYGYNDGPVWAGRGSTTVLESGVAASIGPVSLVLAPLFFHAENLAFALMPNGRTEPYSYNDWVVDGGIDEPQRFGPSAYQRLEPGQSTLRVDANGVAIGFTTANEHWGPARDHPVLLGNNAAGFPRAFLGTSRPANVWVGSVHARIFWGKLYSSRYTYMHEIEPDRFATGLAATFTPRGVPGLEIGAGRFFHVLWSSDVISPKNFLLTFGDILDLSGPTNPENQLASLFARWVFPDAGFEVYGEFGREDRTAWDPTDPSASWRDLQLEPDHNSAILLGVQRVLSRSPQRKTLIRGEVLNTRISALQMAREQARFYAHGAVGQGHTSLGQVLGSAGAFGGGAATLAVDAYSAGGRRTISWSRIMRAEKRSSATLMAIPEQADVMHALSVDGLRFRGRLGISYEVTAVYELNRHFTRDAFNVRLASGVCYAW